MLPLVRSQDHLRGAGSVKNRMFGEEEEEESGDQR